MPDPSDVNRYSFHAVSERAGVSPEFVHSDVIEPVRSLLEKARKAQTLKVGDADYNLAVETLRTCGEALLAPLEPAQSNANKATEPSAETASRTFGSSF